MNADKIFETCAEIEQGNYQGALDKLDRLRSEYYDIANGYAELLYCTGLINRYQIGDAEKALRYYRSACEMAPLHQKYERVYIDYLEDLGMSEELERFKAHVNYWVNFKEGDQ